MTRRREVLGFTVSYDGPNPNYRLIQPGSDWAVYLKGRIDTKAIISQGLESGFSYLVETSEDGEIVDFSIDLKAKPDARTAEEINSWFTKDDFKKKTAFMGELFQIAPTCTISLRDGISVARKGKVLFELKPDRYGLLKKYDHKILAEDGPQIRQEQDFTRRVHFYKYPLINITLPETGKRVRLSGGVRFPNLSFDLMNQYFLELIRDNNLSEEALREFVDPFFETRQIFTKW